MIPQLVSLLSELKTLAAVAVAARIAVPAQVTNAISGVLGILALPEAEMKPEVMTGLLADVSASLAAVDKSAEIAAVKKYAAQVQTLVDNIRGPKPVVPEPPASVIIKDVPVPQPQ